jgi:hypothetical protein
MRAMAVEHDDWRGLVVGRTDDVGLSLRSVLGESEGGGSGSFPGRASDNERWYVKPQNNRQGGQVIVSEYLVSAVGLIVGAPVCDVQPIHIPPDLAGHGFATGLVLEPGVASASRAVPDAIEDRGLLHRERDDNRKRHAGVFVLYDWCWGGDPQWLYSATEESKLYSHDHGWYFPPEGPTIEGAAVTANVDVPRPLGQPDSGLDGEELERLAAAVEGVSRAELAAVLNSVPASWPISDATLEALGHFLERRTEGVARRTRDVRAKLATTP